MRLALAIIALLTPLIVASERRFDLVGRLDVETPAAVTLHGATSAFSAFTRADARGRFKFTQLLPGAYTVVVYVPRFGEQQRTIDIGPSSAGSDGRVQITIELSRDQPTARISDRISARELSIPASARREYDNAQKKLAKRDVSGAVAHLQRSVEIAPQFTEAWNNLGTIAYHSEEYTRAEQYFIRALEADREAYAPLVNLGGVQLNLKKFDDALKHNLAAVLKRPTDALANSQLGITYLVLDNLDLAEKYLVEAVRLDPAHFSNPQLVLAELYTRRKEAVKAADQLESFLKHHPDWPDAAAIRDTIRKLR